MDTILKDRTGDLVEFEQSDEGVYVSVEQDGKLTTAGPFTQASLRTLFHLV